MEAGYVPQEASANKSREAKKLVQENLSVDLIVNKLIYSGLGSLTNEVSTEQTGKILKSKLLALEVNGKPMKTFAEGKQITVERTGENDFTFISEQAEQELN